MARTGKNSPLGVNVTGSVLNHTSYTINKVAAKYMGASKRNAVYSFGSCVSATCLRLLTWAIHDAYNRGVVLKSPAGSSVYDNIISIGLRPNVTIPALGNSRPPSYVPVDPSNIWARDTERPSLLSYAEQYGLQRGYSQVLPGPATSGYGNYDPSIPYGDDLQGEGLTDQKHSATWYPYDMTNPNHSVTQWGWIRCHALQAWNEFNWNGTVVDHTDPTLPSYLLGYSSPEYQEFCSSFMTGFSFVEYSNQAIMAAHNANKFLKGTYSNMNDLVTADIAGISLSTKDFGIDMANLGKAFNTNKLDSFGLPSTLLATLGTNNAITPDLSLALLAAGLETDQITAISSGSLSAITEDQERAIYGAFLIITGENLAQILAPLQCITQGLTSLADLLNVKKMFPNSYTTLTVPKYNATPGPTNSKTYYLIYNGDSVNTSALDSPEMRQYVGIQVPKGVPPVSNRIISPDPNNYSELPMGFGAYARGIIPDDQAIAAGALSFTMRQVRKIESVDFKNFSKVAGGMETMQGLTLVAGTDKPTDQGAIDTNKIKGALGSGAYGTYTMSDLFGCMSGLPYPWKKVFDSIRSIETQKLYNIYDQLFLAVTWEPAQITVIPETRQVPIPDTDPVQYQTEYRVGSFAIADNGGGYYRGKAPPPTITCDNGGTGTTTIGMNNADAASLGGGSYGRVKTATVSNKGNWQLTVPIAYIECPPTADLPVTASGAIASGGTNTSSGTTGWASPMNSVVQKYIDQANVEISSIMNAKVNQSKLMNQYWNILGTQLKIEHRARYIAFPPTPVPKDWSMDPYHMMLYNFTDSIPSLSQDTRPHMSAQTLEAITDFSTLGGQSTVAAMRQERNQTRLQQVGIDQDNDIPYEMSDKEIKTLTTNGTIPGAIDGIPFGDTDIQYTFPAWPSNINDDGNVVEPNPVGIFIPEGYSGTFSPIGGRAEGSIQPILDGIPYPVVSTQVPKGITESVDVISYPIIQPPSELDPSNLPPNLNPNFMSSALLPSSQTIAEAIDQVITCNCDCWID